MWSALSEGLHSKYVGFLFDFSIVYCLGFIYGTCWSIVLYAYYALESDCEVLFAFYPRYLGHEQ